MQSGVMRFPGNHSEFNDGVAVAYLPVKDIHIADYQRRRVNKKAVNEIVRSFNPHLMRPIEVSSRDGRYYCWDGQHRLTAYERMGYTTIPCHVHKGLTYTDEARLFAQQQSNVTTIKANDIWNALVESGDEKAKRITMSCAEFGFRIHPFLKANGNICAVKALQTSYDMLGEQGFKDMLFVLWRAWDGDRDSTTSDNILGLSMFIKHYNLNSDAEINRLAEVIGKVTPNTFAAMCGDYRAIRGGKKRAAQVILSLYNRHLSVRSKLPSYQF